MLVILTEIKDDVFRAYDIRGIYPRDIDADFARLAAKAYALFIKGNTVAVSMDVRLSNEKLARPFIDGLLESGLDVWFIGVAPTPLLYFAVAHYKLDGGAAVSASHNPPEWNGFKLCGKQAKVLGLGEGLEKIRDLMREGRFAAAKRKGELMDKEREVKEEYERFVKSKISIGRKLRIGVDPGNGASSGFASGILSRMGMEVAAISDNPNGRFPSRNPEPKPDTLGGLQELVKDNKLDFGVAFDGDGDRAIFVDDRGEVFYGDKILALFVDSMLRPGDKVVYDVSCSDAVADVVDRKGGIPLVTRVGHSAIEARMLDEDARIGGELSGHIYFRETYHYDDAFFAAAWMAKLVADSKDSLSALLSKLPRYRNAVREFEVADSKKFKVIEQIRKNLKANRVRTINLDGVKAITEDGWFIIRASNTTPKIKVVAEAKSKKRLTQLLEVAKNKLDEALGSA